MLDVSNAITLVLLVHRRPIAPSVVEELVHRLMANDVGAIRASNRERKLDLVAL